MMNDVPKGILRELERRKYWIKKARKYLEENGIDAEVRDDRISVDKNSVKIELVPLSLKKQASEIQKLKKLDNWVEGNIIGFAGGNVICSQLVLPRKKYGSRKEK